MSTVIKKSQDESYLDGLEEWCKSHPDRTHWDTEEVAQWLIDTKQFGLRDRVVRKEIAKKLARAQNRARVKNKQGKRVRVYHAAKLPAPNDKGVLVQNTFWASRLDMDSSFAHASFDQRQKQAEGFCRSMSRDAD